MFSEADRQIFEFDVRGTIHRCDPLAADMRLVETVGGTDVLDEIQIGMRDENAAIAFSNMRRLIPGILAAFNLVLFEDQPDSGVTLGEALGIFGDYIAFKADLEKKLASSPEMSPSTAIPPVSASTIPPIAASAGTGPSSKRDSESRLNAGQGRPMTSGIYGTSMPNV